MKQKSKKVDFLLGAFGVSLLGNLQDKKLKYLDKD